MQKADIVPDLKKKIDKTFEGLIENDESLSSLIEKIENGGSWEDAQEYAAKIGQYRSTSLLQNIKAEDLLNGQMYYNIADRIIPPDLESDYELISEICMEVQNQVNEAARIGIKAQKAELNTDRIEGIVNRISSEPFDDVNWLLEAPIENFMRSVVDDHVRENADFHYKSGLNPVIKRTTDGKCCKWCSQHAGTFTYKPDMDREVFRRHENCGCLVAYYPDAKSKQYQNVWNKKFNESKARSDKQNKVYSTSNVDKPSDSDREIINNYDNTKHIEDRKEERGITEEDIQDTLDNPLEIGEVKIDKNGKKSYKIIGEKCTVYVNPETGKRITVHKTHSKTIRKLKREKELKK